jgi:hypothetical protein
VSLVNVDLMNGAARRRRIEVSHVPDPSSERYRFLLEMHSFARWTTPLVRWGLILVGLSLFSVQAMRLVDTNLGFSERVYTGVVALAALLGFSLLGVVVGRLIGIGADLAEVLIDIETAAERTADLTEKQLMPALHRLARGIEQLAQPSAAEQSAGVPSGGRQPAESKADARRSDVEADDAASGRTSSDMPARRAPVKE